MQQMKTQLVPASFLTTQLIISVTGSHMFCVSIHFCFHRRGPTVALFQTHFGAAPVSHPVSHLPHCTWPRCSSHCVPLCLSAPICSPPETVSAGFGPLLSAHVHPCSSHGLLFRPLHLLDYFVDCWACRVGATGVSLIRPRMKIEQSVPQQAGPT